MQHQLSLSQQTHLCNLGQRPLQKHTSESMTSLMTLISVFYSLMLPHQQSPSRHHTSLPANLLAQLPIHWYEQQRQQRASPGPLSELLQPPEQPHAPHHAPHPAPPLAREQSPECPQGSRSTPPTSLQNGHLPCWHPHQILRLHKTVSGMDQLKRQEQRVHSMRIHHSCLQHQKIHVRIVSLRSKHQARMHLPRKEAGQKNHPNSLQTPRLAPLNTQLTQPACAHLRSHHTRAMTQQEPGSRVRQRFWQITHMLLDQCSMRMLVMGSGRMCRVSGESSKRMSGLVRSKGMHSTLRRRRKLCLSRCVD